MGAPISIRLDDSVRAELEAQAHAKGVGLATLLRDLATSAVRAARRARTREDSARVAKYVASSSEAQAFFDDWGTPTADLGSG